MIAGVQPERDYLLGTHDEELERLGLQHRVWRPYALDAWSRAGITVGKRVIDVGAGPGYVTTDLAEIVGLTGEVVAVERSRKFVEALRYRIGAQRLKNVQVHELDLMVDELPGADYDFSWCRWVAAFVSDPSLLVTKLSRVLKTGGVAIFHEYAQYDAWRYCPPLPHQERFREQVIREWRAAGGNPDSAPVVVGLLREHGFHIRSARPLIFCIKPGDYMWQWPAEFIDVYLPRLRESGTINQEFEQAVRTELEHAETTDSLMITPLVLEIVAEKQQ
jgi:ubiquinone/menaquinone biosynthesis C-methylase UbiE